MRATPRRLDRPASRSACADRMRIAVYRDRYPSRFIIPKKSRHDFKPVLFLPANKISNRFEGVTITAPYAADLGHFHNRIPVNGSKPYVMSFESHLPRYYGGEKTKLFQFMRSRLASPTCRRIIAM